MTTDEITEIMKTLIKLTAKTVGFTAVEVITTLQAMCLDDDDDGLMELLTELKNEFVAEDMVELIKD